MDVDEILAELDRNHDEMPRVALEEAAAHREEIVPRLLAVLEEVARDPVPFMEDQDRNIHIYAMYLLAQFRETRAYPLLVKVFSLPARGPFRLAGSVVTQDLASILASVSDGDPGGMMELVENGKVNEYVRASALDGIVTLFALGKRPRDFVVVYLRHLFQTLERNPSEVWNGVANVCADLGTQEFLTELRQAYDEGLVAPGSISWGEVEEALEMGPDTAWEHAVGRYELITNTAEAISWWSCFRDYTHKKEGVEAGIGTEDDLGDFEDDPDSLFSALRTDMDFPQPYHRTAPKVGRNDPCPCGSGKKYKKCCGR